MRDRTHAARLSAGGFAAEDFPEIDGRSVPILCLKRHMRNVARDRDVTVLILGESGTGKDRVAAAIHRASVRARAPFVVVNCAGLAPTLAEDELFGHVRGAFTGAHEGRPGAFERAAGGTVFLDEIGDLGVDLQMKLLRAIQQRAVQRLGDVRETSFDVRLLAATNVDLAAAVVAGRFRADLYYRLNVYELRVPPLRERGTDDARALARVLLERSAVRRGRSVPAIDPAVMDRLMRYRWPGNVRELENTIEHMIVAAAESTILSVRHLPDRFSIESRPPGRRDPLSRIEMIAALERHDSRPGRAAAALGLSRHQFYRLARRYQLPRSR
jgi:transcriptional regulator with PAS, ATPase and Fis domain